MNELPPSKIKFNCDFCNQISHTKRSLYYGRTNHFCSRECYGKFVKNKKRPLIVKEFTSTTPDEFKKEYPDVAEVWANPKDFDKPLIYEDPFKMFDKAKTKATE